MQTSYRKRIMKRLKAEILLPLGVEFAGGADIPYVIPGNIEEFPLFKERTDIVARYAAGFRARDAHSPAPKMQTPLSADGSIERKLFSKIDM